jgi:Uma2 family endonuclease
MATATLPEPTAPATSATPAASLPGGSLWRFTLAEYDRLIAEGFLRKRDPVILLDGLVVTKMTKGRPHVVATNQSADSLRAIVPAGWYVRKEDPIALPAGPEGADSAPEPDVTVVRGGNRDYTARNPGPGDIALVVEVAESSLSDDRNGLKRYAWASIPVVWIVNLIAGTVEVYTRPTGPVVDPRYGDCRTYKAGEDVPVEIDGREVGRVRVADLLP